MLLVAGAAAVSAVRVARSPFLFPLFVYPDIMSPPPF
jgi:hypothetical protein